MKILHLITSLDCGGAEKMLAKVIRDSKHEHHVISLKPRGVITDEINAQTYYAGWKVWQIYGFMKRLNPDVLMTWLYHADLVGLILGRLAGVSRIIWNIRCSDMRYRPWHYQWWIRKLCALLSKVPTMIVINSKSSKEFHKSIGYHPMIWKVIPNGFDTEMFKPRLLARARLMDELGLSGDERFIGIVARNHPMKDYRTFIKAAVRLSNIRKDVHFILVGKDVWKEPPDTRGNIDKFHLLGERHDLPLLLPALDVLCMTSAYGEGFPNVVGEAMSCGVPCVVTDVGDAGYLVHSTGIVVPVGDYQAIADNCNSLLNLLPSSKHQLGLSARHRIKTMFNIDDIRERYEAVYT